jgi:hypothetical protein
VSTEILARKGLGGDFTPGVERARAAGYKIEVRPYVGTGEEQVQESLTVIAKKIRDGRLDPDVRGWVGDVLKAAGDPKTRRGKVSAILDAFRQSTIYVSDPVGAEYIVAAGTTMCLRPGLCVKARDCDDGCVAVGAAISSAGIPVLVIKQNFGPGKQEHVLVEAQMEDGSYIPADPSTNLPAGDKVPAVSEERIDPMDVVGSSGTSGPEIVTLGALPTDLDPVHKNDHGEWTVKRYGQWWIHEGNGVGWVPVGTGEACCAACAEKDASAAASGTAAPLKEDGDEGECSACELWAKRAAERGELERYGVSGTPKSNNGPKFSLVEKLRQPMGLGADVPSTTTTFVSPTPITTPSGNVGVGAVASVAAIVAIATGVAWGLGRSPRRRRAA